MKPKVSVIMPSLNVGAYIKEALDSVTAQTLREIEIICIDAGSTDGTREIIEECAKKDRRITIIDSPIKSYGHQVNLGLGIAKGEYIEIVETDDYIDAAMCERLYEFAVSQDLDYVKSDYDAYITNEDGRRVFTRRCVCQNKSFYEETFIPNDYPVEVSDDSYLWNGIYKRAFLEKYNISFSETPGAAFQDVGFLHKVKFNCKRARYIPESFYRYCTDRDGSSSNTGKSLLFLQQEYGLLEERIDKNDVKECKLLYVRMARAFARACMETSEDFFSSEVIDICEWFKGILSNAQKEGYFKLEDIPISLQETYSLIVDSIDKYVTYRKNRKCEFEEFLLNGKPIVIFGCGIYGREALGFIKKIGFDADYFMDNAASTWGSKVCGIPVVSPNEITSFSDDTRIIIANEKYSNDIYKQVNEIRKNCKIMIY